MKLDEGERVLSFKGELYTTKGYVRTFEFKLPDRMRHMRHMRHMLMESGIFNTVFEVYDNVCGDRSFCGTQRDAELLRDEWLRERHLPNAKRLAKAKFESEAELLKALNEECECVLIKEHTLWQPPEE